MTLAPVLIPTLNRYEHLKKCLDSLSQCTLANQTEVYIALDYPPSEKYIDGWKKNREYLISIGNLTFKKIYLIERLENYGTWKSGDKGNAKCLVDEISMIYDRYIMTEDDNIFAPNFLEFMNKGLNIFENDDSVFAISGYRWWFPIKFDNNTFFRQSVDFTPWGIARWVKKDTEVNNCVCLKKITAKNIFKLLKRRDFFALGSLFEFALKEHEKDILIDQHFRIIIALLDKDMIIPTVSLVKNLGMDGSGVSMPKNNLLMNKMYDSNLISSERHFEFIGDGFEYYEENYNIYKQGKEWKGQYFYFIRLLKKICKYFKRMIQYTFS